MIWQWISLPSMQPQAANPVSKLIGLLKRRNVAFAMIGVMLTFLGAFSAFTYLRPFLETYTHVTLPQLSLLLLGLGLAGFIGTTGASAKVKDHLYPLLRWLPLALAIVTVALLVLGHKNWAVAPLMIAWGAINSAVPVCWSTWLTQGIGDEPESGGGLLVGAIQLSIMLGGLLGGMLLDHISIAATMIGATVLLVLSALVIGNGKRLTPIASIRS